MLLGVACLSYILRTIGYILVPRMGFTVLSLDLLHGISYACSQTAGVEFMARIIPDSYEASGQGLLLLIRGLGATVGLLSGGMIQDALGGRGLYGFLCGIVTFGFTILVLTSCLVPQEATQETCPLVEDETEVTREKRGVVTARGDWVGMDGVT